MLSPDQATQCRAKLVDENRMNGKSRIIQLVDYNLGRHDFNKNPIYLSRFEFMLGGLPSDEIKTICDEVVQMYRDKGWFVEFINKCAGDIQYREYYFSHKPMKLKGWLFKKWVSLV